MSADAQISCESCQDLLTELVCDELSADTAARARAHAKHCERCGPALQRLQRTLDVGLALPLLTPSPDVEKHIMQAARSALQSKAKGPLREAPEPPRTSFLTWCARIGSWAMSPQVAMASVLLLMVSIGLYALPLGQDGASEGLHATDEVSVPAPLPTPATSATAAPTPEEASGERDQLADRRPAELARRGRDKLQEVPAQGPKKSASGTRIVDAKLPQQAAKPKAERIFGAKPADGSNSANGADPLLGLGGAAKQQSVRGKADAEKSPPPPASRPAAANYAAEGRFAPPPPAAAPGAAEPTAARGGAGPAEAKEERAASAAKGASSLSQGVAAAQRGDLATAQKLLAPIARQGSPQERAQASLWLARSLRSAGDCVRALTYYRTLTQSVSVARAVLEEAADCYERTGSAVQASRLRARTTAPATKAAD